VYLWGGETREREKAERKKKGERCERPARTPRRGGGHDERKNEEKNARRHEANGGARHLLALDSARAEEAADDVERSERFVLVRVRRALAILTAALHVDERHGTVVVRPVERVVVAVDDRRRARRRADTTAKVAAVERVGGELGDLGVHAVLRVEQHGRHAEANEAGEEGYRQPVISSKMLGGASQIVSMIRVKCTVNKRKTHPSSAATSEMTVGGSWQWSPTSTSC
jgi:hypothetical protein